MNKQLEKRVVHLDFGQQKAAARSADGWLQGRYYTSDGLPVRDFLSFNEVFEICPFEVGVDRRKEKRAFNARLAKVTRLLELSDFMSRPFQSLSNGEMRRVLFARAILKAPDVLVLDDPMAGLDPVQREKFKKIVTALSREGIEIRIRCRHADELPAACRRGKKRDASAARPAKACSRVKRCVGEPVVELCDISVRFGKRVLFDGFNWTVRRGERWILKGRNGSGKTTLLAIISGDSPLGYSNEVTVFGVRRGDGALSEVRSRIGMVSPEMQTYSDEGAEELLDVALAGEPELLLLDEPCLNLGVSATKRQLRKISAWLDSHPSAAAICVAHRPDHVPPGFTLVRDLDA